MGEFTISKLWEFCFRVFYWRGVKKLWEAWGKRKQYEIRTRPPYRTETWRSIPATGAGDNPFKVIVL